jgi:hypothetical protein
VDIDVMEPAPDDKAFLRRRLLGIGLGGAAVSLLPFLSGRASATTPPTTTSDTTAATTTTAPPLRPTDGDVPLLGFAQSVELASRQLYDVALGTKGLFDDNQRAVIAAIRESHSAYAAALSAILGRLAPQTADSGLIDDLKSTFSGKLADVLQAAYGLESTAVATHTDILGQLQGIDGAALIASILVVEARHGTVLASMNGSTKLDDLLVAKEADALSAKG